jgi:hypothetical protein
LCKSKPAPDSKWTFGVSVCLLEFRDMVVLQFRDIFVLILGKTNLDECCNTIFKRKIFL